MKAVNQAFTTLLSGNKQFVVPVLQRDYSWTAEQCERLWHDVWQAGGTELTPHFMGSVVYVDTGQTNAAFSSWLVIDGQQRLTTLMLLLIALRNHIRDTRWAGGEGSPTAEKIDACFLRNTLEEGAKRCKLALRRHDDATFRSLVDGDALDEANGSAFVLNAFDWFAGQMAKESNPCLIDRVWRGICGLEIVTVTLDEIDHPQIVLESLNATGEDLTQSDLVRNHLLMELDEPDRTALYEEYWADIEERFVRTGVSMDCFLRDYMALKSNPDSSAPTASTNLHRRASHIHEEFKNFKREHVGHIGGLEALLEDIRRFAGDYLALMGHGAKAGQFAEAMRSSVTADAGPTCPVAFPRWRRGRRAHGQGAPRPSPPPPPARTAHAE